VLLGGQQVGPTDAEGRGQHAAVHLATRALQQVEDAEVSAAG